MGISELDKDVTVALPPTIEKRPASTLSKSHKSETSNIIGNAELEDDNRSSISVASSISIAEINQALTRNTGHAFPGDKELADLTAVATNATQDPRFEIDFDDNGENPRDWSIAKKSWVIFCMSFSTLMVVMYSTIYTSGIPGMMRKFGVESQTLLVLGITTYLIGLAVGSLLLAPLSEMYGRRPVYLITILIMRFFGAIAGAAMISNAPGTVNDIVSDEYRAFAFSVWSIGPMNGPSLGPMVGGFVFETLGWRFTDWVPLIGAVVYGVLYLCFVAYPIVFGELRGWSPGFVGLGYVGIGVGGVIAISCEPLLRRMIHAHKKDPETGKQYPEAMVSVVCIAAVSVPVGELIFGWTCLNTRWIAPILAGAPFGAGNTLVFIYASSYLVQSYGIYAASALAGNAVLRSFLGGSLPLAGPKMYQILGPHWSATMLSLLEFAMIPIPVFFYFYGHKIREKSTLIRQMAADREKLESKKKRMEENSKALKGVEELDWSEKKKFEV